MARSKSSTPGCPIAVEAVQFVQPEVIRREVECRFGRVVWIPSKIPEVLHQHEGAVEFLLLVLGHSTQHLAPGLRTRQKRSYQLVTLRQRFGSICRQTR